ncbi:MAG TPA: hypothetical protein VG055_20780 [Planctomycetaceae bacterium]|jgi:cytoskeletal protein RodZ|nr:hypothetical protein [Planctomycetaceae bacterium]
MRELPLDQIEELVEESVFHPSPCKRHRERVLKNALQAAVRQKVSRRTIGVALAAVVLLGIGIVIVRSATSSGDADPTATAPTSATTVESSSAVPPTQPSPPRSMGEGLYRTSGL